MKNSNTAPVSVSKAFKKNFTMVDSNDMSVDEIVEEPPSLSSTTDNSHKKKISKRKVGLK